MRPVPEAETRSRYERKRRRSLLPEYGLGSRGHSFASSSLWGKFGGLYACGATFSYIVPLPKSSVKSIVLRSTIEKEGLPRDGTPALGAGGPRFKSGRPDQSPQRFAASTAENLGFNLPGRVVPECGWMCPTAGSVTTKATTSTLATTKLLPGRVRHRCLMLTQ